MLATVGVLVYSTKTLQRKNFHTYTKRSAAATTRKPLACSLENQLQIHLTRLILKICSDQNKSEHCSQVK